MSAVLRRGGLLAAGVLLLAGLGLLAWPQQETPPEVKAEAVSFVSAFSAPVSSPAARVPVPPAPAPVGAAPPPPGVNAAQWAQLQAELGSQPGGAAELQRLSDYFRYAHALERFRSLRGQHAASPELPALARELDRGLPERLQRQEISVHEAQQIKSALMEVLVPDASQRRHQLALWRQAQLNAAGPDPQAAARDAEFQRRQAALVAAWSARPADQRDPQALETALEALRRASYPAPDR